MRRVCSVRSKICEWVGRDVGVDIPLGKKPHYDLARSRTVATGLKIRERTMSGIDLLTLGLFESGMKRRHTGRMWGGSDESRKGVLEDVSTRKVVRVK